MDEVKQRRSVISVSVNFHPSMQVLYILCNDGGEIEVVGSF